MATSFAAAPSHFTQPTVQQQLYGYGGQHSPMDSNPTTPTNISPTSPRTSPPEWSQHGLPTRQLRPPKSLLYVPAVLRPTEKPVKNSPPKNGRTGSSGTDGLVDRRERRTTGESVATGLSTVVADEYIEGPFCKLNGGKPIESHWKRDADVSECEYSACGVSFSIWNRRHHCRRCGNIFCWEHSKRQVPLDQHAHFHPDAARYRACDVCFSDWMTWETARIGRGNSAGAAPDSRSAAMQVGASLASPRAAIVPSGNQPVGSLAASGPRDWNWSTF